MMNVTIQDRVVNRGGKWGVRAFRLALALTDKSGDGFVTPYQTLEALRAYGVIVEREEELVKSGLLSTAPSQESAPIASLPTPSSRRASGRVDSERDGAKLRGHVTATAVSAIMLKIVGSIRRDTMHLIGVAFEHLKKTLQRTTRPSGLVTELTVSSICSAVHIDRHPDVESSKVPIKDALFCYYSLWGLPLSAPVSFAVFLEFHTDLLAGQSPQVSADLLQRLYDVTEASRKEHEVEGMASLVPRRDDSDRIFSEIDMNGNGLLSLAELDLAVIRLWPAFNFKPAIMRAYKLADKNGNGTLSKSEFFAFLHYLVAYGKLMQLFRSVDTDHDGRISFAELRQHKRILGLGDVSDVELREVFRAMDCNNGGFVLFEEFAIFMAKRNGDIELNKVTSSLHTGKANI